MTSNPLGSTPFTPYPDPPSQAAEEHAPQVAPTPQKPVGPPESPGAVHSSSDDLGLLLVQSSPDPFLATTAVDPRDDAATGGSPKGKADVAGPGANVSSASVRGARKVAGRTKHAIDGGEPLNAPTLQSSSENELGLDIRLSPSPDVPARMSAPARGARRSKAAAQAARDDGEARVDWPMLLTVSYASAVTLALAWLLWSGRGLALRVSDLPPGLSPPAKKGSDVQPRDVEPEPTTVKLPPLPVPNLTELGKAIRLGDLEVLPRSIVHRAVALTRLEGSTGEQRESPSSLVLTLQLTNRAAGLSLTPLDPAFVREAGAAIDHSCIETAGGPRIGMFRLAPESEWSLQDQIFPHLRPGESAETLVVSEPIYTELPKGWLTWHVKLRTRPYQTDVVGIQFRASDVEDWR
jgi:hypothetical protein